MNGVGGDGSGSNKCNYKKVKVLLDVEMSGISKRISTRISNLKSRFNNAISRNKISIKIYVEI